MLFCEDGVRIFISHSGSPCVLILGKFSVSNVFKQQIFFNLQNTKKVFDVEIL